MGDVERKACGGPPEEALTCISGGAPGLWKSRGHEEARRSTFVLSLAGSETRLLRQLTAPYDGKNSVQYYQTCLLVLHRNTHALMGQRRHQSFYISTRGSSNNAYSATPNATL